MAAHYVQRVCATRPNWRALALCLAVLAVMVFGSINPSHASSSYSVNVFANSGFENPPGFANGTIPGWGREFFDANVGSATGVDCARAVFGDCSARLDIAQSDIRLSNQSETITFGHTSLFQVLPPNTYFDNLTDRPDGLDLWLYIQPKFTDYPLVQLRFKAGSTIEMDYVLINVPLLGTGESNSTNQGEAGKAIKSFVLPAPPLSHWGHIERNVKRDWESPMRLANGTIIPGFQLNETLFTDGYVAFNNTAASLNLFAQDNLVLNFTATRGSTGPYLIVADAPSRPLFVTLNNTALAPTQWTYDQTNSLVRMRTSDLGLITIVFKASLN